jgi:hypothetical protein
MRGKPQLIATTTFPLAVSAFDVSESPPLACLLSTCRTDADLLNPPTTRQMTLVISISFCPQRRSVAIPHPFGLVPRQ